MAKVRVYMPVLNDCGRAVITWRDAEDASQQQPFITTDKAEAEAYVERMSKVYVGKDYRVEYSDLDVG